MVDVKKVIFKRNDQEKEILLSDSEKHVSSYLIPDSGTTFAMTTKKTFDRILSGLETLGIKCPTDINGRTVCTCKNDGCTDMPSL